MPKPFYGAPAAPVKSPIWGSRAAAGAAFDPRQAPRLPPLAGEGGPLPSHRLQPDALRQLWMQPPVWVPDFGSDSRVGATAAKPAAVLIPIVCHAEPTVLFTQRAAHLSSHAGQISFPGGRIDPGDNGPVDAALRETHEEVGVPPAVVQVLGRLPTYRSGTGYQIEPVVGLLPTGLTYTPNPLEVDAAFEVPLAFLMDPRHHSRHAWVRDGVRREWYAMPYQDGAQERYIWGVTAALLRNLYRLLSAGA